MSVCIDDAAPYPQVKPTDGQKHARLQEYPNQFNRYTVDLNLNMYRSFELTPEPLQCSNVVEGTTLFLVRFEYHNLFHTATDWWARRVVVFSPSLIVCVCAHYLCVCVCVCVCPRPLRYNVYQVARSFAGSERVNVVFLDGHAKSSMDEVWEAWAQHVWYVKSLPPGTCFRRALFVPYGYASLTLCVLVCVRVCGGVTLASVCVCAGGHHDPAGAAGGLQAAPAARRQAGDPAGQ